MSTQWSMQWLRHKEEWWDPCPSIYSCQRNGFSSSEYWIGPTKSIFLDTSPVQSWRPRIWCGVQQLKRADQKVSFWIFTVNCHQDPPGCWCLSQLKDWRQRQSWVTPGWLLTTKLLNWEGDFFPHCLILNYMIRVTRLETSRMRRHLARWRWMVIRRSIQVTLSVRNLG